MPIAPLGAWLVSALDRQTFAALYGRTAMFTNASAISAKPAFVRRDSVAGSIPTAVVIDFARARTFGDTTQIRAALSGKNRNRLPLGDLVVIVGLFLATTYYPTLIWLLLFSSGE
jgi:hypothetical protein